MFTASLNLDALKQASQNANRICAVEGCDKPVAPADQPSAQHCSDHSQERAERPRRSKKARR
jgi:hypothetical protein